jgi:hypothetical protein
MNPLRSSSARTALQTDGQQVHKPKQHWFNTQGNGHSMTAKSSLQIAPLAEAEAFFSAHPEIDAIDIIFTNMCGVPRGKRLRA